MRTLPGPQCLRRIARPGLRDDRRSFRRGPVLRLRTAVERLMVGYPTGRTEVVPSIARRQYPEGFGTRKG
ncbi:hypothetical protein SBA1_1310012 [Candidatus Sulfotelmatobacter kueseliae]|uniref:Uncharacterized protein n=1 Tax=Candidatus Sulfotelmatobacter kueseliae TaxID=2042962 RepID=A0A2U3K4L8_9BACT|nr:hypothetical protein SBA1_1310012 [Candidatus Sulfotelmatobacter kueseliae]